MYFLRCAAGFFHSSQAGVPTTSATNSASMDGIKAITVVMNDSSSSSAAAAAAAA
jgi:hypothetical protein